MVASNCVIRYYDGMNRMFRLKAIFNDRSMVEIDWENQTVTLISKNGTKMLTLNQRRNNT